ncbi:MAG: exodeoxyribonuclease V subunit gamma [Pseudomonadota bacterium]
MLYLYQSNRLERLIDLLDAIVNVPLSAPFESETVVVPSKGMGRWISLRLAERNGICANMAFPLPASFLWHTLRTALGDLPKRSAFDPEVLTWRIMERIADPAFLAEAPRLQTYLDQGDDFRRFELACRIADGFDKYLVYRPDWIAGWEKGHRFDLGPDEAWQQPLWRGLAQDHAEPHRARLIERLCDRLGQSDSNLTLPERIIIFGLSSSPPVFLEVIKALSERTDVCLFVLNPCREPWGEIRDKKEIAREAKDSDAGEMFLEVGNPLLASLGKQGREFFDAILGEFPEIHPLFDDAGEYPGNLLDTLQQDILKLVDREHGAKQTIRPDDRSLQIHVCHSPLREVEALHDQLLTLFDADSGLQPGDVAVLAPDISTYAPLIEAVFAPHEDAPSIPYSIADRGLAQEQPIIETFLRLLDLRNSRFEAEEVLSLLDEGAIRRRFGLADADIDLIHQWVRASGIRWGRDAEHKRFLGVAPVDRHTWGEGLRRVMLGYALPVSVAGTSQPLFRDLLPYDDIEGGRAEIFGRFAAFVETLFTFADRLTPKHSISEWSDLLNALTDSLFLADDSETVPQQLRVTFDLLRELGRQAQYRDKVGVAAVKSWLSKQWRENPGSSGFLTGGVTFCNLVPMRNLPFKVICLLGLNDGDFPRQQRPPGFDLMSRHPRRGDRSRRFDDRYLFLETLLSTHKVLYVSYVGRSIRDNSELPPSVLVADLLDVVKRSCEMPGADITDHVVTHHPLQPFSSVYFRGDKTRPGYSRLWLNAARLAGKGTEEPKRLIGERLPEAEPEWNAMDLETLTQFYLHPARFLLRQRLGIDLRATGAVFENREPFGLDYFGKEAVRRQVVDTILKEREPGSAYDISNAAGLLPDGGYGRALYDREQSVAEDLAFRIRNEMPDSVLSPVEIRFEHGGMLLTAWFNSVSAEGLVDYRLNDLKPRDLLHAWLRHLALCLARPEGAAWKSRLIGKDKSVVFNTVEDPELLLAQLLKHYRRGLTRPLPFFIKSSYAYAERIAKDADADKALGAAHKAWDVPAFRNGNFFGESENAYYDAIYRGTDPLDTKFCELAVEILLPMIEAVNEE